MRRTLCLLLGLALASPGIAGEGDATNRVFVEVVTERTTRYVGEVTPIRVRIGYDAAWFEDHAVALFPREVDVALHLRLPWLGGVEGSPAMDRLPGAAPAGGAGALVAVNDELVRLRRAPDEVRDERTYRVLELDGRYVADGAGRIVLDAPLVRFAHATRFEEGFLDERVPLDRREASARGEPLELTIRDLPLAGRPSSYVDAVGVFRLRARAAPLQVEVGEMLRLTLTIEGEGNLTRLSPPATDGFEGFHVYGVVDDRQRPRRTVVYELACLDARVREVPDLELAAFDPTPPGAYRVVRTGAMALQVEGAARPGASSTATGKAPDASEAPPPSSARGDAERTPAFAIVLIALLLLGFLGTLWWAILLRRRLLAEHDGERDARHAHVESARSALRESLDAGTPEAERRLRDYLAAELDCAPPALVAPALIDRLEAAGLEPPLARRVARWLDEALAQRYGAPARGAALRLEPTLVDELFAAFDHARG